VCAALKGEMQRKLDRNILDVVYYFGENSSVYAEPLLFFWGLLCFFSPSCLSFN